MLDGSSSLHPTDQTFSSESYINYEKKIEVTKKKNINNNRVDLSSSSLLSLSVSLSLKLFV
jgi:hypothetical protein